MKIWMTCNLLKIFIIVNGYINQFFAQNEKYNENYKVESLSRNIISNRHVGIFCAENIFLTKTQRHIIPCNNFRRCVTQLKKSLRIIHY